MVGFGAVLLSLAFHDLWRGVWPLNGLSLFFGLILAGGTYVCGSFVFAGITAANVEWDIEPGSLSVRHQRGKRQWCDRYLLRDIDAVTIETREHDSSADTYVIVVELKDAKRLTSPNISTLEGAKAARNRLMQEPA